jgi:putative transposase
MYHRHRFPPEVINYAVLLYFRFPLSLRMVEELLAARGICVSYETVRRWGKKFGKAFADQLRQRAPARGDKWHMDEVVVTIAGEQHTGCGGPSTRMASCSTFWSSAEEIPALHSGS